MNFSDKLHISEIIANVLIGIIAIFGNTIRRVFCKPKLAIKSFHCIKRDIDI